MITRDHNRLVKRMTAEVVSDDNVASNIISRDHDSILKDILAYIWLHLGRQGRRPLLLIGTSFFSSALLFLQVLEGP